LNGSGEAPWANRISNYDWNVVTKLRTSDKAVLGTFTLGTNPHGIAFDGQA